MPLYRTLSGPMMAQIEITSRCNHKCLHCYNYWRGCGSSSEVDQATDPSRVMTALKELQKAGVFNVVVTGGEPLLERELLYEVMAFLQHHHIVYSVNTNLTLLTEDDARKFKELGVFTVLTSILGDTAELHESITGAKGSFAGVIRGISLLQEAGVRVVANMVVNHLNKDRVKEVGKLVAENLGVKIFSATKASPPLSGIDFSHLALTKEEVLQSLDDLLAISAEYGISVQALESYPICLLGGDKKYLRFAVRNCRAGITACAVAPNGDLRPCVHADMIYGNIVDEGLETVWTRMDDWRSGEYIPLECSEQCAMVRECSGGCRMEAKCHGDICGKDPSMTVPFANKAPMQSGDYVLDAGALMQLEGDIRYRKEEFGAIVTRTDSSGILLVNDDGLRLIEFLASLETFTPEDVANKQGVGVDSVVNLVARLNKHDLCRKLT